MKNKDILKKKILYRSIHRGTKEMDLLLGNFVSKFINTLNESELYELKSLLEINDEILHKWYFNLDTKASVPINSVSKKLKKYKL